MSAPEQPEKKSGAAVQEARDAPSMGRRLADKAKVAFGLALTQGRDAIAERLALCHQAIIEDDNTYPGVDRRDHD